MEKKELKDLKEGDYVFLHSRWRSGLRQIQKITPKGFIKVDGSLYNTNGNLISSSSSCLDYIEPLTEREVERYLYHANCRKLKEEITTKLNLCCSMEKLKQIDTILGGK